MESKVIDAIRSNPEQQLRQAELFLKSLTPYGSSESDRQIDRKIKYVGAFKAFVTDVLKKSDPDSAAFTDFSMFLAALPASLSPIREAVAWETMVAYKNACLEHMRFVNTEWSEIPKFWALQFDAVIEKQITEGIVTKERTKPAQWHGAASVLTMVRAYFAHAFRFGPPCWDNVIAEVLCVTLQSALIARQGDVGLSDNWVGSRHFMQYSHVDVRLHDQAQDAVFFAKFTMKESKDNRHSSDIDVPHLILKQITDPKFVFVDPLSLLLVQALRFGAVNQSSMTELVHAARAHPERKVVWTHPEWPVLIAAGVNGKSGTHRNEHSACRLDPSLPASRLRVNKILQRMATLAGFLGSEVPKSHDLRRGSVEDIKELPLSELNPTEQVMGFAYAAELADHSDMQRRKGMTDKYVGTEISKASLFYRRLKWAVDPRNINPYRPVFKPVSISGLKRHEMTRQRKPAAATAKIKSSEHNNDSTDASDDELDALPVDAERPVGLDLVDGDYDPLEGGRVLETSHLEFIDKFSRINTFGTLRHFDGQTRASDNSREVPAPHTIYCENKSRGCSKVFDGKYRIERIVKVHELKCSFRVVHTE